MTTILILTVIILAISLIVQHNHLKQSFKRYASLLKRHDDLKVKEQQLRHDKYELSKQAKIKLTVKQLKPIQLDSLIAQKQAQLKQKSVQLAQMDAAIREETQAMRDNKVKLAEQYQKLKQVSDELVGVSDEMMYEEYGLYKPRYDCTDSEEYKQKLKRERAKQR